SPGGWQWTLPKIEQRPWQCIRPLSHRQRGWFGVMLGARLKALGASRPWARSGREISISRYAKRPDATVAVRVEIPHRGGEGPARARLCALLPGHGRIWRGPAQLLLSRAQPLS